MADDPKVTALLQAFRDAHQEMTLAYRAGLKRYVDSGFDPLAGDAAVSGKSDKTEQLLDTIVKTLENNVQASLDGLFEQTHKTNFIGIAILAGGVLVAFFSFLFLAKTQIVKPTKQLMDDLERLAHGNFTRSVSISSEDEIGQVARHAENLQRELGETVRSILDVVTKLGSTAGNLSTIANETRTGVVEQHSETDQVATAINEMTATVQEVSNHATQAANAAGVALLLPGE